MHPHDYVAGAQVIARLLTWLSSFLKVIVITRGWRGEPYLERFVFRSRGSAFRKQTWGVYLHHFLVDDDHELHNHPFHAASLILTGGYIETRLGVDGVRRVRVLRPGMINRIRPETFHRVDLRNPDAGAWTLFFYWDRKPSWGFWNPLTQRYTEWRAHRDANARRRELRVVR